MASFRRTPKMWQVFLDPPGLAYAIRGAAVARDTVSRPCPSKRRPAAR